MKRRRKLQKNVQKSAEKQANRDATSDSIRSTHKEWIIILKFSKTLSTSTIVKQIQVSTIKEFHKKKG